MAWSAPPTFVNGNVLTAAQMNTLVADLNQAYTAKAVATYTDLFAGPPYAVSTAANVVTQRQPVSGFVAGSVESTTSTVLDDPTSGTPGPAVTVTSGTQALVLMECTVQAANTATGVSVGFAISGATTSAASEIYISLVTAAAGQQMTAGAVRMATGLNAGSNTFTMKYVVGSGTAFIQRRYLTVMPF